ncbi:MAG: RusA family crossover junction endodeoxyribonuclease, partial [Candidatus Methylomirabilales bacterium]
MTLSRAAALKNQAIAKALARSERRGSLSPDSVKGPPHPYSPRPSPSASPAIVHFTVSGVPCSVNRCYRRSRNGRLFMSKRGRAWKEAVAEAAARALPLGAPIWDGVPLRLTVRFYFDRRVKGTEFPQPDDDGPLKPTRDALEGVVYT